MSTVKQGNHTHAVDEMDWCVSQMGCLSFGHFENYYLMIPCCHQGIIASQIGHRVEPDSLLSVEIHLLIFSAYQWWWQTLYWNDMWFRVHWEYCCVYSIFQWPLAPRELVSSHCIGMNCSDSLHLWFMKSLFRKWNLNCTEPNFLSYMLELVN